MYTHILSMQFPYITYDMALYCIHVTTIYQQNTNIEKIHVNASERSEWA